MRGLANDLKLAVRTLAAARAVSLAAVLVLALGTGINTAVLAVAYGILLRPLPYPAPSRVAVIALRGAEGTEFGVPGSKFDEWQRRLRTVRHLGAYSTAEFTMRGVGEPRVMQVALVRGDFFAALGLGPLEGQLPAAASEGWVLLTARAAARLAGGSRALGRTVTVGAGQYVVSAILPDSFAFPSDEVAAWLPASSQTALGFGDRPDARTYRLVARLLPGATQAQAAEDASRVLREIEPPDPGDRNAAKFRARAAVVSIEDTLTGRVRPVLVALAVAALLVLLVACGNVASLFMGRAVSRQADVAVRLSLGATRWHLVRGVLAESLVVALVASTLGAWLGFGLVRIFRGLAAGVFPRLDAVAVDLPVLVASAGVAFAVAAVCGGIPALHASRTGAVPALRGAGTSSRPARRVRAALGVGQIALSVVLLAGAGLVARTVMRLLDQASGIEPRDALSLRLVMSDTTTFAATTRVGFVRQVAERARALPGVRAAGVGSGLPPRVAPLSMGVRVVSGGRDEFQVLTLVSVTPGYLEALGARLLRGRMFGDADLEGQGAAILSESAARHLSPRQDAVGRPLPLPLPSAGGRGRRPPIVGVVADIKYAGLDSTSAGAAYVLWPDLPAGVGYLVVRSAGSPATLAPALRSLVRQLDPSLPVAEVRPLDDEILASIADRRLRLVPALGFGILALVVALVGLSASMTRAVAERRRELAIRAAIGASPRRVLRMVLFEGVFVALGGLVIGLGLALALGRTLTRLLYGVSPHDPATLGAVAALVAAAALGVCYLAARRALDMDLVGLLRTE